MTSVFVVVLALVGAGLVITLLDYVRYLRGGDR